MKKRYIVKLEVQVQVLAENQDDAEDIATEIIETETGRSTVVIDTEQR